MSAVCLDSALFKHTNCRYANNSDAVKISCILYSNTHEKQFLWVSLFPFCLPELLPMEILSVVLYRVVKSLMTLSWIVLTIRFLHTCKYVLDVFNWVKGQLQHCGCDICNQNIKCKLSENVFSTYILVHLFVFYLTPLDRVYQKSVYTYFYFKFVVTAHCRISVKYNAHALTTNKLSNGIDHRGTYYIYFHVPVYEEYGFLWMWCSSESPLTWLWKIML